MSITLRCPTCQERFEAAGSLETGELDTRCPHCSRKRQRSSRPNRAPINIPEDPFTSRSSAVVWMTGLAIGAAAMIFLSLIVVGLAIWRYHAATRPFTPPTSKTAPANPAPAAPEGAAPLGPSPDRSGEIQPSAPSNRSPYGPSRPQASPLPGSPDSDWNPMIPPWHGPGQRDRDRAADRPPPGSDPP